MQLIPQIESNGFSISLGRLDQYCWPYLKADLAAGTITLEQAQELLDLLWLKFCEILRVDSRDAAEVNAGYYVAGQNIEVGGVDRGGHDCTNLLSYLCLNANRHISPILQYDYTRGHLRSFWIMQLAALLVEMECRRC